MSSCNQFSNNLCWARKSIWSFQCLFLFFKIRFKIYFKQGLSKLLAIIFLARIFLFFILRKAKIVYAGEVCMHLVAAWTLGRVD